MLRFLYLYLGLMTLGLPACKREVLPELVEFTFVIPVSITPSADTVARGDTLWLTAAFSDSLLDLRSNRRYRVSEQDMKLTSAVGFRRLLGVDQPPASFVRGFTVVSKVGQLLPGGATFSRLEFLYDGQRYRARIGIVPQIAGVFSLNVLSALQEPFGPEQPLLFLPLGAAASGNPQKAMLDNIYFVINDGDVNFPLQQQHYRVISTQPGTTEDAVYYEQKGTFTFVVR